MPDVGPQEVQHGREGVVVGHAVEIERAAHEMAVAVGEVELAGGGHLRPRQIVDIAVDMIVGTVDFRFVQAVGLGQVAFHEKQAVADAGVQVRMRDIREIDGGAERWHRDVGPCPRLDGLKLRIHGQFEAERIGRGIEDAVSLFGQLDMDVGAGLGRIDLPASRQKAAQGHGQEAQPPCGALIYMRPLSLHPEPSF